ncbi:hypothetical protein DEA8626_03955 [Defluviimonas aquaemixtae]|uniref:Nucleotide-diphospho-sugar transferase domain-containing protein n=1 Tax=Albidovulum aquaemixtae TaxID=1542388 RepID=A0A2R8BNB1_9RHOB|nr:hypothetical protein [Defluviimonas aquaemixtae]SPH24922.1 hypothetical protein DEA8626_03955 [Defluviimonas aquaemixtae]
MAKIQPNVFCIAQAGRLGYEAVLLLASFRAANPDFSGRVIVGEPQPGPLWTGDTRLAPDIRALIEGFGAEILPFESRHFGQNYPYGNKIEGLSVLPAGEPFVFFDTDTLFTGPVASVAFDFDCPSASMRREGTWPEIELYGPGYGQTWKSLYDKFGLDFESTLDLSQPDEYWQRYLYFNAGWFFYRCPREFGGRFLDYALAIRDDAPEELACQSLDPWLDQIALPLVIHSFGGGRPGPELDGLDGEISCHYRLLPLLYARESDAVIGALEAVAAPNQIKKVLKQYEPMKKLVFQKKGHRVRALFDQNDLPRREQAIRNTIKRAGLWLR